MNSRNENLPLAQQFWMQNYGNTSAYSSGLLLQDETRSKKMWPVLIELPEKGGAKLSRNRALNHKSFHCSNFPELEKFRKFTKILPHVSHYT